MSDSTRIEELRKEIESHCGNCDRPNKKQLGELILSSMAFGFSEGLTTPFVDRLQGEWIESFKKVEVKQGAYRGTKFIHDGWSCSECSEVVEKRYPNCPYCLARMKGADDETD